MILVLSHLFAFVAGGFSAYMMITSLLQVREYEGHAVLTTSGDTVPDASKEALHRTKTGFLLLVAAIVLIGIGVQARLATDDNADRDAENLEYIQCLEHATAELVEALDARVSANNAMAVTQVRKDESLDELLYIVALMRRVPPEATEKRFDRALAERLEAQQQYREAARNYKMVRKAYSYDKPEC